MALRRRETTEIHQMRVATDLHANTSNRCPCEVGSHDSCGPAVEGEWSLEHSGVAKPQQLRFAGRVSRPQNADGFCPVRMCPPGAVANALYFVAQSLARSL